jgi:hypothetical protein
MRVPLWLGWLATGEVGVSMMTQIRGSSNAKAKQELGWAPKWESWRSGFRHGLADGERQGLADGEEGRDHGRATGGRPAAEHGPRL